MSFDSSTHSFHPETQLDPSVTFAWIFGRLFRLILITLPTTALSFPLLLWIFSWKVAIVLSSLYILYQFIFAVVWPPLEYRNFRYDIRGHDFILQHGVLFKRSAAIPLHRIQHIDTFQGPIERLFGISTLMLYTASGVTPDGIIPGLTVSEAQELRDQLSQKEGDDGV